jgi:hypothetical protein
MQSNDTPTRRRFLSTVPEQTVRDERSDEREALTIMLEACDRALPLLTPGTTLHTATRRARWGYAVFLDIPSVREAPVDAS